MRFVTVKECPYLPEGFAALVSGTFSYVLFDMRDLDNVKLILSTNIIWENFNESQR